MDALTPEKRDSSRGSFKIRIFDWHSHFQTKINLIVPNTEPVIEKNVTSYDSPSETKKEDLYEKAKLMIDFDDMVNDMISNISVEETDILNTPELSEEKAGG